MYRKSSSESRLLLMASYSCCLTSVVTVTMVHLLRFQPCFAFIGRHPYRNDRRTAFSSTSSTFPSHLSNSKGTFSEPLIPETNPYANTSAISLAGVSHSQVLDAIHRLYPPQRLDERNAMSRTDGYWPFIQKGGDAPKQFTYGEFDFYFFAQLLDHARKYYETSDGEEKSNTWDDKVFADIGSGTGRLVFSAAALHPGLKCSRGIEVLPNIHQTAMDNLLLCRSVRQDALVEEESHDKEIDTETKECPDADSRSEHEDREGETVNYNDFRYEYSLEEENDDENKREHRKLILSAMDFVCGSFEDPYVYLGDADCIFCFSSCMPPEMIDSLAVSIGRQCRPGTVVITTERMLPLEGHLPVNHNDSRLPSGPFQFRLMEKIDGWSWLLGGKSTAYIHQVVQSQWKPDQTPLDPPSLSLEEQAYLAVQTAEQEADPRTFLVGVYNNMVFAGMPERFWPDLENLDRYQRQDPEPDD